MPDQMPHPETVGRRLGALAKAVGCDYETIAREEDREGPLGRAELHFLRRESS